MKNENELVIALQKGNRSAFKALYQKYSKKLYYFSLKYIHSPQEAEGVVQNVFLKIWENRATLKPELSFNAYLIQIGKNIIFNYFKRQAYEAGIKHHIVLSKNEADSRTEDLIIFSDLEAFTQKQIDLLPPKRKQVFILSRNNGLSHEEIGRKLGISPNTVKQHINKALKTLGESFDKYQALG